MLFISIPLLITIYINKFLYFVLRL